MPSDIPSWLNYQGRLTQPDGQVVVDDEYTVVFRLFEQPTGGSAVWSQSSNVTTRGGVFQTTLGYTSPFTGLSFDRPYWLEIEVLGRTLIPRQPLAASAYAFRAKFADSLANSSVTTAMIVDGAVTTPKIANGAVTEAKLAPGLVVPIGSVISWWGDSENVPDGWKLCDGTAVNDSGSPLNGTNSPDLRNKFVRGAVGNVRATNPIGGNDTQVLSVGQLPPHNHGVNDPGHSHGVGIAIGWGTAGPNAGWGRLDQNGGDPGHGWSAWSNPSATGITTQNTGSGQPISTVPSYAGLVLIMRIR